ncbi:hypothetical protein AM593_03341, partial [Mytilus galloprovincialis]
MRNRVNQVVNGGKEPSPLHENNELNDDGKFVSRTPQWPVSNTHVIVWWFQWYKSDPLKEPCVVYVPESVTENIKPPLNCDFCRNLHRVDHINNISIKDFESRSNCDNSAANILRQHYTRPYFLPEFSESSKTDWIFMGSPGYGAHLHIDHVDLPSWQAQITVVLDTNKWYHSTLNIGENISITIGSEYD